MRIIIEAHEFVRLECSLDLEESDGHGLRSGVHGLCSLGTQPMPIGTRSAMETFLNLPPLRPLPHPQNLTWTSTSPRTCHNYGFVNSRMEY